MTAVTVSVRASDDGSLTIPRAAVESLGLRPGDEASVRIVADLAIDDNPDQIEFQMRLDRFFEHLDTIQLQKPDKFSGSDEVKRGFAEIMDEKYLRLGFKP